jgi:ATP-binding cassette, subfamily C, bacterial CydC
VTRGQVARRLLGLLRPLAPLMAVSGAARVVNQGLGVAIPAVAAAMVIGFDADASVRDLLLILGTMALVKGVFRYVEQFTGHAVAFRLLAELRVDTYRTLVPLAPVGLEEERTGDLVTRAIGDIDRVEPFYAHTVAPMVSAVLVPVLAAVGLAIWIDPAVAVAFVLFPLLIVGVAPWLRRRRVAELSMAVRDKSGETAALFIDAVQGARDVAVFEAEDVISGRVESLSTAGANIRSRLARVAAARSGIGDLLSGAAVVVVALVALGRYDAGALDVAAVAAAIVVAWVGTGPARAVEGIVPDLEQALAAAARLFELSDRPPAVMFPDQSRHEPADSAVSFEGVTVTFARSDAPGIDRVDAAIAGGAYVAVVGPSGAGKSTLVELLVRFRDPDQGRVSLGGVDLTVLDRTTLRERVTLVPQRPDIFYGSIASNLLLADPAAAEEKLWNALDRAGLGEWVRSLPQGLATTTGEIGEMLSGGQRQRLAIARAFLRDPQVLILDEATSELDLETERRVLEEIAKERGHRTVIVVAHRLEAITDADEILVLDRGRLVERGRHLDLASSDGVYAGLWRRHLDVIE